jgi:hypothetical protein
MAAAVRTFYSSSTTICRHINDRWRLHCCIYSLQVGRYPHEEEEEEGDRHYHHEDVEHRLWECGNGVDVHNAEQRWAYDLVPETHSVNVTPTIQVLCGRAYPIVWITLIAPNNRPASDRRSTAARKKLQRETMYRGRIAHSKRTKHTNGDEHPCISRDSNKRKVYYL